MLKTELKVIGGKHHGKLIPLATAKFLIGRELDCQLRPTSEMVSRHHCVFTIDDYTVHLRDMGSRNGTIVNGAPIVGKAELKHGDNVRIGNLEFELVIHKGVRITPAAAVAATQRNGGSAKGSDPAIDRPTPLPVENTPTISGDTSELSSGDTMYEMPVVAAPNAPPAPVNTGDTALLPPGQLPPAAPPAPLDATQPYMPSMPMPGYPQMPGYPPQMPGYPQMPYAPYPYQQMPPQYYPPGMPYQPQMPYPMPPQPAAPPTPAATANSASNKMQQVAAPPVNLPPPDQTGAHLKKGPVGSEGTNHNQAAQQPAADGKPPQVKPSQSAADILKQMTQRRPGGT